MNEPAEIDATQAEITRARRDLLELRAEADKARAVLSQWQQFLVAAESPRNIDHTADLLEANEQLVISAVQAKTDSESAMRALVELVRVAELDALTQLPNRLLFLDRFTQAIANGRRRGRRLALLFIDLNNFKHINDSLGHSVGDEALKRAARCMIDSVRASDTVCRHGGDEFLILLDDVSQAQDAALIADKINAALAVPTHKGEHVMRLTASIGISLYPDDGDDPGTLIEHADAAMYRAKQQGVGGFVFHQQPPAPTLPRGPVASPVSMRRPPTDIEPPSSAHETLHAQLQEANEQLLLSALDAKQLHEAAEQALKRHVEQMARAVHELRNPLMSIRTASVVIGRTVSTDPLLPRMNAVIERQVSQMSRLICDLLDVSRINGGKLRLELRQVEMHPLIDDVVEAMRPAIDVRLQRLAVQVQTGEMSLYGDSLRLAQVLRNLLDNASKYTPCGGEICLVLERIADNVVMTVTDNGIGISARSLPHIFDPFVQDRDATAFNGEGLGLGLTVVRELVQSHHGSVTVRSAGAGLGSEFVVTLPVNPPPAS